MNVPDDLQDLLGPNPGPDVASLLRPHVTEVAQKITELAKAGDEKHCRLFVQLLEHERIALPAMAAAADDPEE